LNTPPDPLKKTRIKKAPSGNNTVEHLSGGARAVATEQSNRVVRYLCGVALRQGCATLTDGQLLDRFLAQRDDASFESLIQRHGPMVLGVCRRVLRNEADAEDAFQATFLVLVRKAASIVPRGMVGNWLYGVAHNTARKAKVMNSKRRARERQAGTRPRPEARADDWQRLQAVLDDELSRLPEKYRAPIVLCELEGKSIKEAARRLGWVQGTLAGRLSRGRTLLARRVARHGLTISGLALAGLHGSTATARVPAQLVGSTVQAATAFAAGQAAAVGVVPAHVAALSEGVLKGMLLTKMKITTAAVLVVVAMGAGTGEFAFRTQAAQQPASAQQQPAGERAVRQGQPGYGNFFQQRPDRTDEKQLRRVLEELAAQARDLEAKAAALKEQLEVFKQVQADQRAVERLDHARRAEDDRVVLKKREAERAVAAAMEEIQKAVHRLREATRDPQLEVEVLSAIERSVGELRRKAGGRDTKAEKAP
jgi:RNA polymerase sigma factor (sigma-70 family)